MSGIMQQIDKYNKLFDKFGDAASKATKEHIKLRDSLEDQSKAIKDKISYRYPDKIYQQSRKCRQINMPGVKLTDVGQNNMLSNA